MTIPELYEIFKKHPSVQTDTRLLQPGDIFFALKGPNFDGNRFAADALDNGAALAVADNAALADRPGLVKVDDSLQTLQALAKYHRQQFSIPFIAITGSNGKTTSKELVSQVLGKAFRTYTTQGNLNNHIGIPLTLLRVKPDAEMAVIEMGANHRGEIAGYCTYALPSFGIITNVGKAHLEGFGGEEGVRLGKGELYDFLRNSGGSVFLMWDYDYLREMSQGIGTRISYGSDAAAQYRGHILASEPFLKVAVDSEPAIPELSTQLVGDYNFPNVMLAVAVGRYFKVPEKSIREAIEGYQPANSRSQLISRGDNTIILDAYNANPSSMKLAIESFARLKADSKVLLLGAMAELGADSLAEHQAIIELISRYTWTQVVLVGGDFLRVQHPFLRFKNAEEAGEWLRKADLHHTHILVKGSRSSKMEKALEG